MRKVKVGIIGCGNISGIYLKNCSQIFKILDVVACADIDIERAKIKASEFNIPKALTVQELLADPEIEIILNLTIPKAHAEVNLAALEAGKNIYSEKPLAITREEGRKIIDLAKSKNLLVGCAPDTFLGAGKQTARKLIDDGWIGKPVSAVAFWMRHGNEDWHPDPEFYYKVGGGPMFDMGPYYLANLINLFGPVKRVYGFTKITFPERTITSQPKYGTKIKVETPTHITGMMDFENGAIVTLITTFDVWHANLPMIEIYGTEGSISMPASIDNFGGTVLVRRSNADQWKEIPLTHSYTENSRGLGVADMAYALQSNRPHRANGELAFHTLDIMNSFLDSARDGKPYELKSSCKRPDPMLMGLPEGELEDKDSQS